MTLRKYKKMLMSYGIDRNLAEKCRKNEGVLRHKLGIEEADEFLDPKRLAEMLLITCNGSLRTKKHNKSVVLRRTRENKNIVVV